MPLASIEEECTNTSPEDAILRIENDSTDSESDSDSSALPPARVRANAPSPSPVRESAPSPSPGPPMHEPGNHDVLLKTSSQPAKGYKYRSKSSYAWANTQNGRTGPRPAYYNPKGTPARGPCRFFSTKKGCKYGDDCLFSHRPAVINEEGSSDDEKPDSILDC